MDTKTIVVLILIVIGLVVTPLYLYNGQEDVFGGSDDSASSVIEDNGYKPWFNSIWEPPSGEIESLIFALQAAIGALIIGFILGYWRGSLKREE